MRKKIILTTALLLALIAPTLIFVFNLSQVEMKRCAADFITNLAENNHPEKYCTGEALYRVKTRNTSKARVVSVSTAVLDHSGEYGRVYAEVEMVLPDKANEVSFYELDLVKSDSWKVYAVRETLPKIANIGHPGQGPVDEIDSVYREYFAKICEGDSSLLVGPALTAYEKQPQKTKIDNLLSGLQTELIYHNGHLVVARHSYQYDNRAVKVIVHYYLTQQGYKIVSIAAI